MPPCSPRRSSARLPGAVAALAVTLITATTAAPDAGAQTVVSGAGVTTAEATAARDAFRVLLGGGDVAGPGGLFGGLRREITWDGAPDGASAPNLMSPTLFQGRGVIFSTPGTGLLLSADDANPTATPRDYADIDPTYGDVFEPFSPQRLFTAIGSNIVDVRFVLPGTSTPGLTRGFGSVFSDVDLPGATTLEFFDHLGASLGSWAAPAVAGNETFSFLGVAWDTPRVSRVRITSGTAGLGPGVLDGPQSNLVAMDDFVYAEVMTTPEPGTWALLLTGLAGLGATAVRRRAVRGA